MFKLIYIMGDGRSGSTLLEGVLSNIDRSVCVGECYRFCNRYQRNETLCGCTKPIGECELWSQVANELKSQFPNYSFNDFKIQQRELLKTRSFSRISRIANSPAWSEFCRFAIAFYNTIHEVSNCRIIIDSSKSVNWAFFLQNLGICKLYIIHLERNLQAVANSWKKKVLKPEHTEQDVYMPIKRNRLILKTWLKVKLLSLAVHKEGSVLYLEHEQLCRQPRQLIQNIENFIGERVWQDRLKFNPNHGIAGNPVRFTLIDDIRLHEPETRFEHLSVLEAFGFTTINLLAKTLLSPRLKKLANLLY